ncbi:MAG: Kelch repeat-containing protein [Armatimonadota bacterium]
MNSAPAYRWIPVTMQAAFAPRDGAGSLVFADRLWLLGGWNPNDSIAFPRICNSEVWSSRDGHAWTLELAQASWEGRHTGGYAVLHDQLWIVGGDAMQGHYQSDVWRSADGRRWQQVTDTAPWGPRVLQHVAAFQDALWVMGGQTLPQYAPAADAFFNDVWRSTDGRAWECVQTHAPWAPRGMIGGCALLHDRLWLLGGGTYDTEQYPERLFYHDVWSTADGIHWDCHTEQAPWSPREYHDVAVFDDKLWVLEGWNYGNRNDVWYSSDGVHWFELPDTPWAPRHAASVYVYQDALWMVAGNNMTSDVWKLVKVDAASDRGEQELCNG